MINCYKVSSYRGGKMLVDFIVMADNSCVAIEKFRRYYPEHKDCIVMAEDIDSEKYKNIIDLYFKYDYFL